MLHGSWSGFAHGRVNPAAPLLVAAAGVVTFLLGHHPTGTGLVAGAALAFFNGVMLSGRVELAADQGDIGRALLVMQVGFLVTCTVIAATIIVIIHFSVSMAIATAIGFVVAQVAMLVTFYLTRARALGKLESKPS